MICTAVQVIEFGISEEKKGWVM